MKFSMVLLDTSYKQVYSSGEMVFRTTQFGEAQFGGADAFLFIPFSQMSGMPWAGLAHWEFADPKDGQGTCEWYFGVEPGPFK